MFTRASKKEVGQDHKIDLKKYYHIHIIEGFKSDSLVNQTIANVMNRRMKSITDENVFESKKASLCGLFE